MDYLDFIEECRNKPEPQTDYQWHHITPKCLGGSNYKKNKIKLSYEDHWKAHQLLAELYPDSKELKRAASLSLEDFINRCQQLTIKGERGNPGKERSKEHKYKLSINHISRYDDGSLSMEDKIERYNKKQKEKETTELRKKYRPEYEEFIKFNSEKADECFETKKKLEQRVTELTEMKKYYNNLKSMTFDEFLYKFKKF